jgi:hypothetical protein
VGEEAREAQDDSDVTAPRPAEHDRLEAEPPGLRRERSGLVEADDQRVETVTVDRLQDREEDPLGAARNQPVHDMCDPNRGHLRPVRAVARLDVVVIMSADTMSGGA